MKRHCCNQKSPLIFRIYKYIISILIVFLIFHYIYENSSIYFRDSLTLPFSLHLNKQDIYMIKGEETRLTVFGINKRVSFQSTNFRVAGVNFNGRIVAYRTGKAFIIAKVDKKELKCRVHVINVNKKKLHLKKGSTYRLKIKGTYAFVTWKSSNKEVATVSMFGSVKARGKGTAVITGKVKGRSLKSKVIVK